jgi:hypothetical protein
MKPRPCWKCATDQPHPFRHWHVRCKMCRRWKIFRGPCCADCHANAKILLADILEELREDD